jgi:hypothetical protein
VHHLTVANSNRTNGNALRLLVQVHDFLQCDNSKEGGTEYGGVSRVAIEVLKLR